MISEHASPLATLGGEDSGGQNVYVAELARRSVLRKEKSMASDEDLRKYLEGVDFPVSTFDLVTSVREQDAPEDVLDRLNQLPSDAELSDPDTVIEQIDRIEEAGKQTPPHQVT